MKKILFVATCIATVFSASCGIDQGSANSVGQDRFEQIAENAEEIAPGTYGDDQIRIRSKFERTEDAALIDRDRGECKTWDYDPSTVSADAAEMEMISQEEWGRKCYQYACSYKGELEIDGKSYASEVNAGGWIRIISNNPSSTHYLASTKSSDAFLAWCNCCE